MINMKTEIIKIEGMSCGHCTSSVTSALSASMGVSEVEVSLENKNAIVTYDESVITLATLCDIIEELGFEVLR